MADIVQLHENGIFKYLKTHVKAVEGLESELLKKEDKQKNIDWTPVTLLNGFTGSVNIRQKNGIVQFTGFLKSSAANGNLNAVAFKIPEIFDIGSTSYQKAFFLPEGEMNTAGVPMGMSGFVKGSDRTFTVWHKNVVGDCFLDTLTIPTP